MKKLYLSATIGSLMIVAGLTAATQSQAAEVPSADLKDQLTTEINQEAASKVAKDSPEPTIESPSPTVPPTTTPSPLIITTGENGSVDSSDSQSNQTTVENQNQADVSQEVESEANTGINQANHNISIGGDAGVIRTGKASVYNQLQASANSNQTGIQSNCPTAANDQAVTNSGDQTTLDNSSRTDCSTTIRNGNGVVINQAAQGAANTGDNQAIGNISIGGTAGLIVTGDATVGSLLVSRGNTNAMLVGGTSNNGGPGTGANIYIIQTGDNAVLNDRRTTTSSTQVDNDNWATVNQLAALQANTGDNVANGNINLNGDAGVIHTGNAIVVATVRTEANKNQTTVSNAGQSDSTVNPTSLTNTGADLDADTSTEVNSNVEVDNTNQAEVGQVVQATANTGRNTANNNIAFNGDAGVIVTGDAVVTTLAETDVNHNQTAISDGQSSDDQSQTTSDQSSEIVNTGQDAEITTSTETTSEVEVSNDNQADVDQAVTAEANTGSNESNGNIGNSSISTGNAVIKTEVITNANNNYTFIIDSDVAGFELFKQFVETFLGADWDELMAGGQTMSTGSEAMPGLDGSIINSGDNVTVLNEQVQNRQVVVNNSNQATVNQTVTANANTGGNSCLGNVGDCQITTGDATVWTRLIANLNNNFTFIGNVVMPEAPEQPEEPETPTEPESPTTPETSPEREVKGVSVERQPAVLAAATTLPNTGGSAGLALSFGSLSLGLGLALKRRS